MLVLIGIGFSIGNHLGGKFADLSLDKTLIGFFVLLIVSMLLFPLLAKIHWGSSRTGDLGHSHLCSGTPLQMRVMSAAHDAPDLRPQLISGHLIWVMRLAL